MDTIAERLKLARQKAGFATPTDAARENGWVIPTYLGHENGDRNPGRENAKKYARAFKVRWEWILEGEGPMRGKSKTEVPVMGYAGAGDDVRPIDDFPQGEALEYVEGPPGASEAAVAVIVRGNSMWPRYMDGEKIFYDNRQLAPDDLLGRECLIRLKDGRYMVKILRRGSRTHRFNLEGYNSPTLENVEIDWAAPVKWRA